MRDLQSELAALRRRQTWFKWVFSVIVCGLTALAGLRYLRSGFSVWSVPLIGLTALTLVHLVGRFLASLPGVVLLARNRGPITLRRLDWFPTTGALDRTAVLLPVRNEPVDRFFAGLAAMGRSLAGNGEGGYFDLYVLSDTDDPDTWIEEELAWSELKQELGDVMGVHYRRRDVRLNAKQGNVADFLRRWGRNYRFMILLDADSVMSGETMKRLVRAMCANPEVGILSTQTRLILAETLFGRYTQWTENIRQSVNQVSMDWMCPISSGYFGHNAIIRVAPFMEHCGLPNLPVGEPLRGRILSHDYVEAALMRSAGWAVWLVSESEGSYEECPPTLKDKLVRDHRWCQGNLQYFWLLLARGWSLTDRISLFTPSLRFLLPPAWLAVGSYALAAFLTQPAGGLTAGFWRGLLSAGTTTAEHGTDLVLVLAFATLILAPDLLAGAAIAINRAAAGTYGGRRQVWCSIASSLLVTLIIWPIELHAYATSLLRIWWGHWEPWRAQTRSQPEMRTTWTEAARVYWGVSIAGTACVAALVACGPPLTWMLGPFVVGAVIAIPCAVALGSTRLGRAARERGLFLTPEECRPPAEVLGAAAKPHPLRPRQPWLQVLRDAGVRRLHLSLLRRRRPAAARAYLREIGQRLIQFGPGSLTAREQLAVLRDPDELAALAADPACGAVDPVRTGETEAGFPAELGSSRAELSRPRRSY